MEEKTIERGGMRGPCNFKRSMMMAKSVSISTGVPVLRRETILTYCL
jgi:hypothetical protein